MRAVDTNIIIRFLVKDDPKQCLAVKKMFEKIENLGDKLWVSNVVVLEMVWVLRSRYTASRDEILTAVKTLLDMVILEFQDAEIVEQFYYSAQNAPLELDDLLIGMTAKVSCDFTWTFDRKVSKSKFFRLLK